MGFYSRNNEEQSRLTDEVYAAIQRCKGVVLGDGHLSAETEFCAGTLEHEIVRYDGPGKHFHPRSEGLCAELRVSGGAGEGKVKDCH